MNLQRIFNRRERFCKKVAGDVNFHPECFMCSKCKKFIGDGDEYALEERNSLFCGTCYNAKREMKLEELRNRIHKGQHTIRHVQLKPDQICDKGISYHIDKVKHTEPKLREEILRKLGNSHEKQEGKKKNSFISIRNVCKSPQQSPLKAGDKVIEVNGVLVTDETIQEVSKILRSKPTETLHVTIERNLNDKSHIPKSGSEPSFGAAARCEEKHDHDNEQPRSGTEDDFVDERKKERSLSFFNFSVFKRATSDTSELKVKAAKARNKKKLQHAQTKTLPRFETKKGHMLRRSRSLTEINGNVATNQKDMEKAYATLHRAQSFKTEDQSLQSKIFRPSDLVYGDIIGKGFFGEVFKVSSSTTGEEMVMKQLKELNKDAEETFLNEVQLLKSLKHGNVLRFIGIMYKDKLLHIIAEYISGGTLRKLLKNKHREISWEQRVQFAKDIASGMAYLHDMNVMHRDLTSKNCLVKNDADGKSIVVADFGLAKLLPKEDSCRSPRLSPSPYLTTRQNSSSPASSPSPSPSPTPVSPGRPPIPKKRLTVVGSPFWMAPEMMKGQGYDEKADIFSFGIVMCEIIGRVKADPDFLPRRFDFGLDEEEFIKQFCSDCPEPFYRLAFQACSSDPEKRPPFATLEKWLEAIFVNLEFKIPLPSEIDYQSMPKPLMYNIDESTSQ
eukprot:Seg794.4 transcript_id=Seg794.4/GoldUCD/mRNA.D3Y31 product="LIM domain kinase 1" protein_id=Seg794.4/GoldUCD/D3Y31